MDEKLENLLQRIREADRLWEGKYYPVTLSDGAMGFFEVIIPDEDEWYLTAYVGEEAVQTLVRSISVEPVTDMEIREIAKLMDCYILSLNHDAFTMRRHEPRRSLRELNKEEKDIVFEILSKAVTASEPAKLPKKKKFSFPAFQSGNELTLRKIRNAPCNGKKWLAHICLHVEEIVPEDGGELFCPYMLMLMDEQSGTILSTGITESFEDYDESFLDLFAQAVEAQGRPKKLITVSERSRDFFKPFCAKLGIEFEKRSNSPVLRDALDSFYRYFTEGDTFDEDDLEDIFDEDYEEDAYDPVWDEVDAALLGMVADPAMLPRMSTELLTNLLDDMAEGLLDDGLAGVIVQELKKREK